MTAVLAVPSAPVKSPSQASLGRASVVISTVVIDSDRYWVSADVTGWSRVGTTAMGPVAALTAALRSVLDHQVATVGCREVEAGSIPKLHCTDPDFADVLARTPQICSLIEITDAIDQNLLDIVDAALIEQCSTHYVVAVDGSANVFSRRNCQPTWSWLRNDGRWGCGAIPSNAHGERVVALAEASAIRHAVTSLPIRSHLSAEVLCDSLNTVRAVNKILTGKSPAPTPKGDLSRCVIEIVREMRKRPGVTLRWTKGHNGHPLNEGADRLALYARRCTSMGVASSDRDRTARRIADDAVAEWNGYLRRNA